MKPRQCESCHKLKANTRTAIVAGKYYKVICSDCLGKTEDTVNSRNAGYTRRREFEDYAADTIQPYDAKGPNPEFYRLYPKQAEKVLTKDEIEQVKRKL
jgi:hypothetical protein